jgi:hypothetical protein
LGPDYGGISLNKKKKLTSDNACVNAPPRPTIEPEITDVTTQWILKTAPLQVP